MTPACSLAQAGVLGSQRTGGLLIRMHNSATLLVPLVKPLRVPRKSEPLCPDPHFPSCSCHQLFQTWPGRLFPWGGGVAAWAQPEEDPEQGKVASTGAPDPPHSVLVTLPLGVTQFAAFIFQD